MLQKDTENELMTEEKQKMTETSSGTRQLNYCEICGIEVPADTELKRFGKLLCSKAHLNQYVRARQKRLGLTNDNDGDNNTMEANDDRERDSYQQEEYPKRERSRFRWFGGGGGGCC